VRAIRFAVGAGAGIFITQRGDETVGAQIALRQGYVRTASGSFCAFPQAQR